MNGATEPCVHCGTFCARWGGGCTGSKQAADPRLKRMTQRERLGTLTTESVDDWVAVEQGRMSMAEKRRRDARRLAEPQLTDEEREWLS